MTWKDLLQSDRTAVLPWVGGRLESADQVWRLPTPPGVPGWYQFDITSRQARCLGPAVPNESALPVRATGYLICDRFVSDCSVPKQSLDISDLPRVHLISDDLERFTRVTVGCVRPGASLVYLYPALPWGAEFEVQSAFLDRAASLQGIPGVTPALDRAFRFESRRREDIEQRREALRLRTERETRERESRLRAGTAQGRRELAKTDFAGAAKAALEIGDAQYLDHRRTGSGEYVVYFSVDSRRFECVCSETLQIIDSGICLTAEYGDDSFDQNTRGDSWFSLESLPSVIREADRVGHLVVFRHAY